MQNEKLVQKFNRRAWKQEKQREEEASNKWRKRICGSVRGETLEIAVGAGMNYAFLPGDAAYTDVDFSPEMLKGAMAGAKEYRVNAEFILSEVETLSFPANRFDTILSTGSLCCYEDPIRVLNLLNKWCKNEGQILLLEHGLMNRKSFQWLQRQLNPFFFKAFGCHQDRDIIKLVEASRLHIVKYEQAQWGYLYLVWAKPAE
ncbi:class I SAM-dependent methyltransferase [Marinococcus halophilus]|uniref:Methyltransferase type 11 domain-containing protein n=1 Tax=Marinococcus halophilus TaxID=1371 RepID=A0A510YAW7_MARHA|nr:class I SAM-dependent methyltransferase [Marinococcus halophilus]OZT78747.1 class I SAM-dependent methyltransferase [Marinococcus halophilus]GEK60293.1 hypothetical protein MHA01_31980 [Marinococcus halophilus]